MRLGGWNDSYSCALEGCNCLISSTNPESNCRRYGAHPQTQIRHYYSIGVLGLGFEASRICRRTEMCGCIQGFVPTAFFVSYLLSRVAVAMGPNRKHNLEIIIDQSVTLKLRSISASCHQMEMCSCVERFNSVVLLFIPSESCCRCHGAKVQM